MNSTFTIRLPGLAVPDENALVADLPSGVTFAYCEHTPAAGDLAHIAAHITDVASTTYKLPAASGLSLTLPRSQKHSSLPSFLPAII